MGCVIDFTDNKKFLGATYASATVGIGVGIMITAPASLALLAAGGIVGGAVAGLAVPALGMGGALWLATMSDRVKQRMYRSGETPLKLREIPALMIFSALNSYQALIRKPGQNLKKLFSFRKQDVFPTPTLPTPENEATSGLTDKSAQQDFNTGAEKTVGVAAAVHATPKNDGARP